MRHFASGRRREEITPLSRIFFFHRSPAWDLSRQPGATAV